MGQLGEKASKSADGSVHAEHHPNGASHLDTMAIHGAESPDGIFGAVTPPIYQTSTFAFADTAQGAARFSGKEEGYIYTRLGNPTVRVLEEKLAQMERGEAALATASGMAAITTTLLGLLSSGDHMIGTDAVYSASRVVTEKHFSRFGIGSDFVDTSDPAKIRAAIRPETRLLFIETPANPTIRLTDIAQCAAIAQQHDLILVVDNTFMSPYLQRPIEHGAHVVVHSMTKFINGHTDVVGGVIVFADRELYGQVRPFLCCMGGTIDPHQAWLVLRGVKTLPLRMRASQENATKLARFLVDHPAIRWVAYPGLETHPQHQLAQRQMDGPGALLAFEVRGGLEGGRRLMEAVRLATLAVSLGGIETLIQHPASMTHASMPCCQKEEAGITDGLVRLSVGCEHYEDLEDDFRQALKDL